MIRQVFLCCCLGVWDVFSVSVDLFNFVEVMNDVREGALSSYEVLRKFGGIVDKNFVIRTNAFIT